MAIIVGLVAFTNSHRSHKRAPSWRDRSFQRSTEDETKKLPSWRRGESRTSREAELSYGAWQWQSGKDDRLADPRLASQRPGSSIDTVRDRTRRIGESPERRLQRGISADEMIDRMIRTASESLNRVEADRGALHKSSRRRPTRAPAPPEPQP